MDSIPSARLQRYMASKFDQFQNTQISTGHFKQKQQQYYNDDHKQQQNKNIFAKTFTPLKQTKNDQQQQDAQKPQTSRRSRSRRKSQLKSFNFQNQIQLIPQPNSSVNETPLTGRRRSSKGKFSSTLKQQIQLLDDQAFGINLQSTVKEQNNKKLFFTEQKSLIKSQNIFDPQIDDTEQLQVLQQLSKNNIQTKDKKRKKSSFKDSLSNFYQENQKQNQNVQSKEVLGPIENKQKSAHNEEQNQVNVSQRKDSQVASPARRKNSFKPTNQDDFLNHKLKLLSCPVKPKTVIKTMLHRPASILNLWPQFHVNFQTDGSHLMSAKKVSRTPVSTYIISSNNQNFEQNSPFYLGKAKSSMLGEKLHIFGPGLSPSDAKDKQLKPRQFLATIIYETRLIKAGQPRDFKIYVKKHDIDYYIDFPEVQLYGDQIPLNQLYENPHNRDKIIVLRNRKPKYVKQIKGYMLNFRGRVTIPSVKNFVIQRCIEQKVKQQNQNNDQNNQRNKQQSDQTVQNPDVIIFGKYEEDKFHFDVFEPLSPCIAFGIVLSSFDNKFFCE